MAFDFTVKEFILGNGTGTPTLQFYKRGFNLQGGGSTPSWQDIILSGNGSLTLTNAKENGLNYLKLFGGTEQRNLPEGYTQVEYIKSNGTQYIDTGINQTTLVKPRIITKYKIDVSEDKDWFGGSNDGGGGIIWNIAPNTTRIAYIRWKTQSARGRTFESGYSESDLVFLSDFHTLDVGGVEESGVVPIIVDNNLIGNMDSTTTLNWVNHNLLIFRSGRSGQNGACSFSYFTIYSNDVKVWDGVACRRNSDNVLGMFDLVSQTFFTNAGTDTFTAGADVVPSPTTPMDIVSNNGVLKFGALGKNLFNPTKVLFGYYRDRTTGIKQQSSSNFMSSDDGYIPCLPNTTYTFAGTNKTNGTYSKYNTIYFFDSAKNYLGASPYDISQPTTGTTPNNCYYLQVRSNPLDNSTPIQDALEQFNWQLEQGSTATPYEPYRAGIYTDGATEKVEVHTKNLFDEQWNRNTGTSTSQATWGQVVSANGWSTSGLIPVKEEQQYTVSYNTTVQIYVFYYESDGTMQQSYDTVSATKKTFTVPSGAVNVRLQVNKSTESAIAALETQLELGSTATTYEPYFDGGNATAEMLLKVGNYQDIQSVLDGEVTRNVGVKVLDGSEDWTYSNSRFRLRILDYLVGSSIMATIISHYKLPAINVGSIANGEARFSKLQSSDDVSDNNILIIHDDNHTDVNSYKSWLLDQYANGTPVIIVYPLATATTESVTGQPLTIQAGTNIVEITQASIDNLKLEVSYKGTV